MRFSSSIPSGSTDPVVQLYGQLFQLAEIENTCIRSSMLDRFSPLVGDNIFS